VSQAKSSWQQISHFLTVLVKDKKLRKISSWALCLLVFVLLWWLNWKLFLATIVGISLMSLCYLFQNSHWQRYCQKWQNVLVGSNRQLLLAVGSGAIGAFCTYLAAVVWADAENQWLATGAILQGFASLTTVGLLVWSLWGRKANTLEAKLEQLLIDLSNNDPLKRLIAIRQLTRLIVRNRLSSEHYWQSIEYYYLMLSQPQVPIVKNALLESLDLLGAETGLKSKQNPIKIPVQLHQTRQPVYSDNSF
jgi:hypothetical protein